MDLSRDVMLIGDIIDSRYQLTELVGRGGSGVVYRATDLNLERDVAIKILSAECFTQKDISERFEQEGKILRKLRAPNTVFFYDSGKTKQGLPYIVMEFVVGIQLKTLLEATPVLTPERTVPIITQVLSSLTEAHELGFIHRDLKPANIMLCSRYGFPDDFVKVLDFGVAKIISQDESPSEEEHDDENAKNEMVGTPKYMPPEIFRSEQLTAAADLYSVGCIAYEMLTGIVPFDGDTLSVTIAKHLFMTPPSFDESLNKYPNLIAIVFKLLEKESKDRFASAQEAIDFSAHWNEPELIPELAHCRLCGDDTSVHDHSDIKAEAEAEASSASLQALNGQHKLNHSQVDVPALSRHDQSGSISGLKALNASHISYRSISTSGSFLRQPKNVAIVLGVIATAIALAFGFYCFAKNHAETLELQETKIVETTNEGEEPKAAREYEAIWIDIIARLSADVSLDARAYGISKSSVLKELSDTEMQKENNDKPQNIDNNKGHSRRRSPKTNPAIPIETFKFTLFYSPGNATVEFLNATGRCGVGKCIAQTSSTKEYAQIIVSATGFTTTKISLAKPSDTYRVNLAPLPPSGQ